MGGPLMEHHGATHAAHRTRETEIGNGDGSDGNA
jgi:hypothetical protein